MMVAASAVLKEGDAGAFASFLWADAANYGAGFSQSWNRVCIDSLYPVSRCRTGSPFPAPKSFLKRVGLKSMPLLRPF